MASCVTFEFNFQELSGRGGPISAPPHFYFRNVIRLVLGDDEEGVPQTIILEKKDEDGDEEITSLFQVEQKVYTKLQQFQGRLIPTYFGIANIDGTQALVLSDLGGVMMLDEKMPSFEENDLRKQLTELLRPIRAEGVLLEDVSLTNVHYYPDGVFRILDFELVQMDREVDDVSIDDDVRLQVESLVKRFQARQAAIQKLQKMTQRWPPPMPNRTASLHMNLM